MHDLREMVNAILYVNRTGTGIISTTVDLAGTIGRRVLGRLMPARRTRTRPRVVKRAISRYNAKGIVHRTSYKATISIDILTSRTT